MFGFFTPVPCDIPKIPIFASESAERNYTGVLCSHTVLKGSAKHLQGVIAFQEACFHSPSPPTASPAKRRHSPSGRKIWKETTWCSFYSKTASRVLSVNESHVVPRHPLVSGKLQQFSVEHLEWFPSFTLAPSAPLSSFWFVSAFVPAGAPPKLQHHCEFPEMEQCQLCLQFSLLQKKKSKIPVQFCRPSLPLEICPASTWSSEIIK